MSAMTLLVDRDEEGRVVLKSPTVGLWRQRPRKGQLARSGESFGMIEVLGRLHALQVPAGVHGVVLSSPGAESEQRALAYGQVLATLGEDSGSTKLEADAGEASAHDGALVFRSSSSGRFYLRPAPEKAAFVSVGDEIETGHIIYLLEVMKTFSRVAFDGEGLPARAKVLRILPNDGDDLEAGQVVLELEAI
jgi:acetyl-CoA carboxylase biotin carboxyl carrier protein